MSRSPHRTVRSHSPSSSRCERAPLRKRLAPIAAAAAAATCAAHAPAQSPPTTPAATSTAAAEKPLLEIALFGDQRLAIPGWEGARSWIEGRWRSEHWSHFETPATDGDYDYGQFRFRHGLAQKLGKAEFAFEWQAAHLFGVDDDAPVGPGRNYRDANRSHSPEELTVRQLWAEVDLDGGFARAGRQLHEDNAGLKYDDAAFQWLRDRGNARLVGTLDWPLGGRTYDGFTYRRESERFLGRFFAFEANEGAFDIDDGTDSLENLHLAGGELIAKRGSCLADSELRLFGVAFRDDRAAARTKFGDDLFTTTVGMQSATRHATDAGAFDLFLWGAVQRGDAGTRAQRAGAWIGEAGWRFESLGWKPWLRIGHARAQGDTNPGDREVNDFYNGLPTNHAYYGFADLFALTNLRNSYLDLLLDPHPQLRLTASAHVFAAASGGSRATFGSGAFTGGSFGYGTFATTSRNFGRELDVTARFSSSDKKLYALLGWTLFRGGTAFERLFATADAQFAYLELGFKF